MPSFRVLPDNDSSALNASSEKETTATGRNTNGVLNQHPSASSRASPFRVGVSEDRNKRWRRTMEDSHAFIYGFGSVQGQGFFGVFDGHAGKHAAEWCGQHFHEYLLDTLSSHASKPVPDLFNLTFHNVDEKLSQLATAEGTSSGCTAVTVFLRLEDDEGKPTHFAESGGVAVRPAQVEQLQQANAQRRQSSEAKDESRGGLLGWARRIRHPSSGSNDISTDSTQSVRNSSHSIKNKSPETAPIKEVEPEAASASAPAAAPAPEQSSAAEATTSVPSVQSDKQPKRVLYTANVGDARAVLCRGGKAVRLTYDHKGSDAQETKRITDAGGFVMNNRVNGVLAVTRSLGDSAMKDFVVGSPYTTETSLSDEDTFLIIACDGLWDVTDDQDAVDLVAQIEDPQLASDTLLKHALSNFSTDNTSVMVVRFSPGSVSRPSETAAAVADDDAAAASKSASQAGETKQDADAKSAESAAAADEKKEASDKAERIAMAKDGVEVVESPGSTTA